MTPVHMETVQTFRRASWEWSYPYSSQRSVPWSICFHPENWSDRDSLLFMKVSCGGGRPGCHAPATATARVTVKSHCYETQEKLHHRGPGTELSHITNQFLRARRCRWLPRELREDHPRRPLQSLRITIPRCSQGSPPSEEVILLTLFLKVTSIPDTFHHVAGRYKNKALPRNINQEQLVFGTLRRISTVLMFMYFQVFWAKVPQRLGTFLVL